MGIGPESLGRLFNTLTNNYYAIRENPLLVVKRIFIMADLSFTELRGSQHFHGRRNVKKLGGPAQQEAPCAAEAPLLGA